ncbi:MAG: endonuclease domain-containing protein [Candidatus Marinimicrobia bacterium]|nr:endonuclease domain-containing protein [Candidatus Neomarinimicrobiota bacterium]
MPTPSSKRLAKVLRKNMTPAELKLWGYIRKRQLNLRFRRQHPIGKYVVDFIALHIALVIEVDGGQHFEQAQMKKDNNRSEFLQNHGLTIVRYNNLEVMNNIDGVIEGLFYIIEEKIAR